MDSRYVPVKGARSHLLRYPPARRYEWSAAQPINRPSGKYAGKINAVRTSSLVMPGPRVRASRGPRTSLVPGIHAFAAAAGSRFERVDGRDKPGHDVI
jgi:hypothetical protein